MRDTFVILLLGLGIVAGYGVWRQKGGDVRDPAAKLASPISLPTADELRAGEKEMSADADASDNLDPVEADAKAAPAGAKEADASSEMKPMPPLEAPQTAPADASAAK